MLIEKEKIIRDLNNIFYIIWGLGPVGPVK